MLPFQRGCGRTPYQGCQHARLLLPLFAAQSVLLKRWEQVALLQQYQEHDTWCQQHSTQKRTVVQGCVRGDSCGFKHVIYEAADAAPGNYRPADSGPPPRRGEPAGRGRGRAFRDGPPHPGRWVRNLQSVLSDCPSCSMQDSVQARDISDGISICSAALHCFTSVLHFASTA